METFEMRYFLGVAKTQNIHKASEELHVSPASLSKAIARLEEELGVNLFNREGRNIRLTEQGRILQKRASEIIQLEEAARLELSGIKGTVKVQIAGPEILIGKWAMDYCQLIKKKFPLAQFEFLAMDDEAAIKAVDNGEVHLALTTSDIPASSELHSKVIGETKFLTYVGKGHPLYTFARSKKSLPVKELLEHGFVSPSLSFLGQVGKKQSLDGWRDDHFPRRVDYLTSSLKLLEEILLQGKAIAYLPEYLMKDAEAEVLKVADCPYSCQQKIRILCRNPKEIGWLNQIF